MLPSSGAFAEMPNSSSHTSLTRSWMLAGCFLGSAHVWVELQEAAGMTPASRSSTVSSSATQRCSLWTCRR